VTGPSDLKTLFFAPGDPLTAYTCVNRGNFQRGPLTFGVSHDGGHTWQFHPTAIPAVQCQVAVNPGDTRSIAMATQASQCAGDGCADLPVVLYISRDGGLTWSAAAPVGGLRDWGYNVWLAWTGNTLFVGTNGDSATENQEQARPVIAASVNGAPLASVGESALRSLLGVQLASFLPLDASLIVELNNAPSPPAAANEVYLWTNAAATVFTPVTFDYQANHIHALAASTDGKALIGQVDLPGSGSSLANPLAVSTNGGASWSEAPAFPQAQYCCFVEYTYGAADGSVVAEIAVYFAEQQNYEPTGVFELRPGAAAWTYVAAPPAGSIVLTVSSDASGRPLAVWAPGFGSGLSYSPLP
jgi:hypothetical protein